MRRRGMGRIGRLFYGSVLALLALTALVTAVAGWWPYALISLIFAAVFAYSAPFVLGKRWQPPAKVPTRRAVVRRKR